MAISSFEPQYSEVRIIVKGRKCQYLGPWAINKKTKDTLLCQTLKVEKKKVSVFFDLWLRSRNMAILSFEPQEYVLSSREKRPICQPLSHKFKE